MTVNRLSAILRARALTGRVTREQLVDAARVLPRRPRLGAPVYADDTTDPFGVIATLSPDQLRSLGLIEPVQTDPRVLRTADTVVVTLSHGATTTNLAALLGHGGAPSAPPAPQPGTPPAAVPQPLLRIRIQALMVRQSDGKLFDGSAGPPIDVMRKGVARAVAATNKIYASTGVEFVFIPSLDIEMRDDTALAQDFIIGATDQWMLSRQPPLSDKERDALSSTWTTDPHRNAIGATYPHKIVLLFAEGTTFAAATDPTSKKVSFTAVSPSGGGHSWEDVLYVKLGAGAWDDQNWADNFATFMAHEMGHYLHQHHTFVQFHLDPKIGEDATVPDADKAKAVRKMIVDWLEDRLKAGIKPADIVAELDGDRDVVSDTPADDSGELINYLNKAAGSGDACGTIGKVTLALSSGAVSYTPDRSLVMSYFKGCTNFNQHFSPDQIKRMRDALINGNRRPLVAVQLGDTASPHLRYAAVFSPLNTPQRIVTGWAWADYDKAYSAAVAQGMRLRCGQVTPTTSGDARYDAIFDASGLPQRVVWGWTIADVHTEDAKQQAVGLRMKMLNTYLLPNGQVRCNAAWDTGKQVTSWIQGWAQGDLLTKLSAMHAQGFRLVHIHAWNLPDGGARFDAVWQPGSAAQWVALDLDAAALGVKYGEMWNQGMKLRDLRAYRSAGQVRYLGRWIPDTDTQFVSWGQTIEQVYASNEELVPAGMRLLSLSSIAV